MLLVLPGAPAGAGPVGVPRAAGAPEDPLKVLVVLDVSGSMARPAGNGLTLLGGARRAIAELAGSLPRDVELGLRVYGSQYGGRDRSRSCRDTRLLVPVGPSRADDVTRAASRLRPTGDTPIGLALTAAANDLDRGAASERVIVLVSDGEDNCSPPEGSPCQVVQGLRSAGVRVRVESIGVALAGGSAAQRALQCVAERSGGSYYDAADAQALSAALERIGSEALGALGAGKVIEGGDSLDRARTITPRAYRITLPPGGEAWFRFRARPGDRPRVLATVRGLESPAVPRGARGCPAWRVQIFNPYGEGGTYPPYGNAGAFDGIGLGTTGASSSGPVQRYSTGIDYSGLWAVRLSLAADTLATCSQSLPIVGYDARFTLDLDGDRAGRADAPSQSDPDLGDTGGAGGPSAADKYNTPVDPNNAPGWAYPAVAVVTVLLVGATVVGGRVWLRRRQWGW